MRIPFNELEEKYFNIIVLYRAISPQEFAQEEPSKEELEKQLTPQKKGVITKYNKKLKLTKSKKTQDLIRNKIYALNPVWPEPIELPRTLTYTIFALFVNGKIIKNPRESDLIDFNSATDFESGGYFNERYLKNIQSYENNVERDATNEEVQTGIYQLNQAEYKKLIDLEIERARAIQSINADISTDDFLISLKEIKKEFNNWFIYYKEMLSEHDATKVFKNVPNSKTENINDKIIDNKPEKTNINISENNQKPKKNKEDVEWIKWLESRGTLALFLKELKDIQFILGEENVNEIINTHFLIKGGDISQTNATVKTKIKWKPARYSLIWLIETCMGNEFKLILPSGAKHELLERHFSDKNGIDIISDKWNRAKSQKTRRGEKDAQNNQKYKLPKEYSSLIAILKKVKEQAEMNREKEKRE